MEIQCIKGMYRLKLVSSENNSGFKELYNIIQGCYNFVNKVVTWLKQGCG